MSIFYYPSGATHETTGRYCDRTGETEAKDLVPGLDFRHPCYRREVFHRFYEFHTRYGAQPGCVYFLLPYLQQKMQWSPEQALWFAFINGNTQNPVTSWLIFSRFPEFDRLRSDEGFGVLSAWTRKHYAQLSFDTDRRHHKNQFLIATKKYLELTQGDQVGYFMKFLRGTDPYANFRRLWSTVLDKFHGFGRLSAFSYLEYLRITGMDIDCPQLFLEDLDGSKSHRNGLAKVLGRDDLDWHESNPTGFTGKYTPAMMNWLRKEGQTLLDEAKSRMSGKRYSRDVSYFTLESTLCTYKSWHRPNRRYPGCFSGETRVLSPEGDTRIDSLVNKRYPVYSFNETDRTIHLAWAFGSYRGERETVILTLDDGSQLTLTADHLVLTRRRTGPPSCGVFYQWIPAGELEAGHRLIPLHRFLDDQGYFAFYELVTTCSRQRFEHRAYFELVYGTVPIGFHVHHENEVKNDNRISNLGVLERGEHIRIHKSRPNGQGYSAPQETKWKRINHITESEIISLAKEVLLQHGSLTCEAFDAMHGSHITANGIAYRWGRWSNFVSAVLGNHKVVSVTKGPRIPVFDMSVDGPSNFFVGPGVLVHNCYLDMLHDRIKKAESLWPGENFGLFWEVRREYLPAYLRLEDNPRDCGCKPQKQNWYRNTGQVIMMDRDWSCFANDYNSSLTTQRTG